MRTKNGYIGAMFLFYWLLGFVETHFQEPKPKTNGGYLLLLMVVLVIATPVVVVDILLSPVVIVYNIIVWTSKDFDESKTYI